MADSGKAGATGVAPGALSALLRDLSRIAPAGRARAAPAFRPGQVVGRFELVRRIGRGGFGVVFEARDRELGRAVALKLVRMGGDLELKEERLLREAEAAAQLSHPNIVALHDVGRCEQGPFLVLELLRGRDLGERLEDGPLPVREALRVAAEIAKALAHAHARGVVHRDLTPRNVFLCDDGQVKVLDFGLARAFGRRKVEGGTRAYMAPEQRRGAPEDERTDVFALGVILREMLAGEPPAPAADEGAAPPPLPGPAPLGALVARMQSADPVARPRDASEVLAALGAVAEAVEGTAPAAADARRPSLRRRLPRGAPALALSAVAAAALAFALSRRSAAESPAPGGRAEAAAREAAVTVAPANASREPGTSARPEPQAASGPIPAQVAPPEQRGVAATPARPPRATPAARAAPRSAPRVHRCVHTLDGVATPPASSGDGVLVVDADPFGEVFVDGRAYGETPGECLVAAGVYEVRAAHEQYGSRAARVRVRPGERARFTADFLGTR